MREERSSKRGGMAGLGILVILLAWVGGLPGAMAQEEALAPALTAFEDGLFARCVQEVEGFRKRFPDSPLASSASLLEGKALYFLGRYRAAEELLTPIARNRLPKAAAGEALFWRAECLCALQRWTEAIQDYRASLAKPLAGPLAQRAQLALGWCLWRTGKVREAESVLEKLERGTAGETQTRTLLLRARIALSLGRREEAETLFGRVIQGEGRMEDALCEARFWLAELHRADDPARTIPLYEAVARTGRCPRELLAQAYLGLGEAYEKVGQSGKAMAALEKALELEEARNLWFRISERYLESAAALQRLPEAERKLGELQRGWNASEGQARLAFAIAQARTRSGDREGAEALLEETSRRKLGRESDLAIRYALGRLYQEDDAWDAAARSLLLVEKGGGVLAPYSAFRLGEIALVRGDAAFAEENFRLAERAGVFPEESLYNRLISFAREKRLEEFEKTKAIFVERFPHSSLRSRLLLLEAELLREVRRPKEAERALEAGLQEPGLRSSQPQLLLELAGLYAEEGGDARAFAEYERLVRDFPNDPLVPEALYRGAFAGYRSGRLTDAEARQRLADLAANKAAVSLAPKALFGAAQFGYNAQDYAGAQADFERIAQDYPQNPLADSAYYWAAKAAVGRHDLMDALHLLDRISESSSWKAEARLLQGKIDQQLAEYGNAMILFDAVLEESPSGPIRTEALLRKGDCLFAESSKTPKVYGEAAKAFAAVLREKEADPAERDEAGFKLGICLQKQGREEDALSVYLDVLDGRLGATKEGSGKRNAPEIRWRIEAGIQAASLKEKAQDWRGAVTIYRKMEELGGPTREEFHETVNRLRRDHFLFEEGS
ncbi:tetratricopeptide repeat protein [Verrucomicrobium sp. 3C]|uniref:tetratricopeptide repeat protein n=1 Tax=Verrucomicrobium sp. 3C TaxID=1134055 RepID=UPI00036C7736|nr:tetratricopeptide repeat protein [Verrucomicrobium sp. 3C]